MPPEPCDTAEPVTTPVPPLGWWDLPGQLHMADIPRIENVPVTLEGLL